MTSAKPSAPGKALLTPGDYDTLASFRYGVRRYLAFAEANARSVGLTSQQHQALLAIKARTATRPMSIGDLAAELLIKHHSTVELVGRLEKAGFTRRSVDVEDRRKVLVTLTRRGEKVLADLSVSNLRELRMIAPAFAGLLGQMDKLSGG
ncbi:MarR family winged helix-turn-helix transcriptional regulator [Phenylobacterium sp.]|uniref:MarR family winged helix-turn-helix transcriptional regulator n=1 Tax=Phenylobacterium sp. TaxID=1871053 RepID=UPI003564B290